MRRSKILIWDIAFFLTLILFLSTKNWNNYNLIIGLTMVNVPRYVVMYHWDYYKMIGKIY